MRRYLMSGVVQTILFKFITLKLGGLIHFHQMTHLIVRARNQGRHMAQMAKKINILIIFIT